MLCFWCASFMFQLTIEARPQFVQAVPVAALGRIDGYPLKLGDLAKSQFALQVQGTMVSRCSSGNWAMASSIFSANSRVMAVWAGPLVSGRLVPASFRISCTTAQQPCGFGRGPDWPRKSPDSPFRLPRNWKTSGAPGEIHEHVVQHVLHPASGR